MSANVKSPSVKPLGRSSFLVARYGYSCFRVSDVTFIFQAEIARQEVRLKMERENLEKEKSVLMGTASNQDNQDGALEITVSGEKYRCLRFAKAKK
ncbi:uncharacterized protein LOC122309396 isoform X4 [Carya illinoinensis]|uniref:uncharacterized protein LOC122309396 isoform X4 n=1 Tax=Carya illinoinensis TaxID=32201 RepID=UPI001C721062|nr:uncharacterized protein LOC122309396 isoform X4 [Carya illinoinensis]